MNAPAPIAIAESAARERSRLAQRLRRTLRGEVLFDRASRGRYATDASIYQVDPVGVVVPADEEDAIAAIELARELRVPILPRGGGTSQCGQTVGEALVIDNTKHLDKVVAFDRDAATVEVQPGIVLDRLNAFLKPHGLWFPVDVSTSAQATIGGMAGNNSCGSRSIAYGNMVHNVLGIDAVLADGTQQFFGPFGENAKRALASTRASTLVSSLFELAASERDEIERVWPRVLRRVGGYNLDVFHPRSERPYTDDGSVNLAHLLVGSEGTLAYFRRLHLKLAPLPRARVLGVVNFPSFHAAMDSAQHIVKLVPTAVELVDRTMIDLARANPVFRATVDAALIGEPQAVLLVEFCGDDPAALRARLAALGELMGELGLPGSVVEMPEEARQKALWEVRKAGLNIMMSLRGDGKPVSFIEDCAVPLEHLAEYTARLTEVFARHGTRGTWYAHASVGTLHVRPILDMRAGDAAKMRSIAEEASAMVRQYKGAFSGEHGDGLVRTEWVRWQYGERITGAFERVKDLFDPLGLMNPGKIVRGTKMDDARLFRFPPGYRVAPLATALDWSGWNVRNDPATEATTAPGTGGDPAGGFAKAVEMCNNNGHCRKFDAGTMCPSYRVTRDERHLTRGRANTLRLALSGRLGGDALGSRELYETMDLCVSCKGCKRECPTGVDMARMKIEFLHQYRRTNGLRLKDRLVAYLPRYAAWASRLRWLANLRDAVPGLAALSERFTGFSARRTLPRWRGDTFVRREPADDRARADAAAVREVVLFADTFNDNFEPENLRAAKRVLEAGGYRVIVARALASDPKPRRALCCGRSFLATGLVEEARAEARRTLDALLPHVRRGVAVVGLEPSCLLTMRDEFLAMGLGEPAAELARNALLFEEFIAREHAAGRFRVQFAPIAAARALLHPHCHQKAFDAVRPIEAVLALVPGLETRLIESSCCGMAGSFGYEAEHYEVSMAMAEASLLPAVRAAGENALVVADGTSCRHQIRDGAGREAVHVARVLEMGLPAARGN
ncbi:MAG TPA: FAD-linked oxidase C-terminal domain-containing protein [Burkholderiaceae bacterium]